MIRVKEILRILLKLKLQTRFFILKNAEPMALINRLQNEIVFFTF